MTTRRSSLLRVALGVAITLIIYNLLMYAFDRQFPPLSQQLAAAGVGLVISWLSALRYDRRGPDGSTE